MPLSRLIRKVGLGRGKDTVGDISVDRKDLFPRDFDVPRAENPLDIAIVYGRIPFPMYRGDQLTVSHWLSYLAARGHRVRFIGLNVGGLDVPEVRDWLAAHCTSFDLIEHGFLDIIKGLVRATLARRPLQTGLFDSDKQFQRLETLVRAGEVEVVYTYYVRSASPWLRVKRQAGGRRLPRSVLAIQLSQSLNTRRIASTSRNALERIFYSIETRLIERFEARVWKAFDRSILIGRKDLDMINSNCERLGFEPISNAALIPHGVDISSFGESDVPAEAETVLFSGNLSSHNNIGAALWFLDEVWPKVREAAPTATLRLVGRAPVDALRERAGRNGVEVLADPANMAAAIAAATVCINPMQSGAGMQNKLIEFLASRKPVVATSVANEGVQAHPGRDLIIADTPAAFADAVIGLLADPGARDRFSKAGRDFVERNWTWEAWFEKLEAELRPKAGGGFA
jgi:glycosyltransferase involved in cell wall biosynthesis